MTDEDTGAAIVLPIEGMTCDLCVSRVDAALRAVPGVTDVAVELAAARAIVRSSGDVDTRRIGEAVYRAGYLPGLIRREFRIEGMNCSTCRTTVERAIGSIRGVIRSEVNLRGGTARADSAATVSARAIIRAVEQAGYSAVAVAPPLPSAPRSVPALAAASTWPFARRRSDGTEAVAGWSTREGAIPLRVVAVRNALR